MEVANEIVKSLVFVAEADYFYQAMAIVTIMASMIGSMVYNGDLSSIRKAIVSIFCYAIMLMFTNISRLINYPDLLLPKEMTMGQQFNGTVTVVYVTFFYMLGLSLGVFIHKRARR